MSRAHQDDDDLAFERLLLSAGRAEAPPPEQTEAALLRFAAGFSAMQGAIGFSSSNEPASGASTGSWARFLAAAKWSGLGFVAGGAAVFGWLQHDAPLPAAPRAVPAASPPPKITAIAPPVGPEVERPVQPATRSQPAPARASQAAGSPRASSLPLRAAKPGSDLAAEVAALDSWRTALSIGAWREAEQQAERYRRTFPQGALRSEAEVLAIEGLLAQGRKQAAIHAGERFIASHPRDPQVGRVRALIE